MRRSQAIVQAPTPVTSTHTLHSKRFNAETVTVYLALRFISICELARIQKHKETLDVNEAQAINSYSSITEEGFLNMKFFSICCHQKASPSTSPEVTGGSNMYVFQYFLSQCTNLRDSRRSAKSPRN